MHIYNQNKQQLEKNLKCKLDSSSIYKKHKSSTIKPQQRSVLSLPNELIRKIAPYSDWVWISNV